MRQREMPVMNVGITLVVLIFMNLCLITFSMLSLQNAMADKKLTEKTANYTTAYYNAVSNIDVQWKDVNDTAMRIREKAKSPMDFYKKLENALTEGNDYYRMEKYEGGYYLICSEPVLEHQRLYSRAKILWKAQNGKYFENRNDYLKDYGSWEADRKIKILK